MKRHHIRREEPIRLLALGDRIRIHGFKNGHFQIIQMVAHLHNRDIGCLLLAVSEVVLVQLGFVLRRAVAAVFCFAFEFLHPRHF